jgi:biotin synthase
VLCRDKAAKTQASAKTIVNKMTNIPLADIIHSPLEDLLIETERVRTQSFGNEMDMCAIVNIKSGRCTMNCRFCAQSKHYDTVIEKRLIPSNWALLEATNELWEQGIRRVGWVASGRSQRATEIGWIVDAAETTLADENAKQLCVSLGQLDKSALKQLKAAGVCRYHHNLETSEKFYPSICTTQRWKDRRATVERVKELGWSVCSGGLFGIGETWEDRLQLALTLQKLEVDSIPINFLTPIAGTPLADSALLSVEEALRIVALFRLTLPKATIRICGGRPTVFADRERVELLFRAGANALMSGNYLTTSGISLESDREMIERCGLRVYR